MKKIFMAIVLAFSLFVVPVGIASASGGGHTCGSPSCFTDGFENNPFGFSTLTGGNLGPCAQDLETALSEASSNHQVDVAVEDYVSCRQTGNFGGGFSPFGFGFGFFSNQSGCACGGNTGFFNSPFGFGGLNPFGFNRERFRFRFNPCPYGQHVSVVSNVLTCVAN